MELEYATIEIVKPANGTIFEVLFNPKEYRLSKGNQFAEVAIPGLSAPPLQFGRGNVRTLSMQLFFDTYTYYFGMDVQRFTRDVMALLEIDSELHAPPICEVTWGKSLSFRGVLERADQRFTLFLPDGTPVRATLDVNFKEFVDDNADRQSANFAKHHIVRRGDTLSAIASHKYGDPSLWREIAEENNVDDPLVLQPGQLLVIPALE